MIYVHENHLNGMLYTTSFELEYDDLRCEMCGDTDTFIGCCEEEQFEKLATEYYKQDDEYTD